MSILCAGSVLMGASCGDLSVGERQSGDTCVPDPIAPIDPPRPMVPLKTVRIPEPADLADYVRNRQAAIVLGKTLFWEMQVGSDGVQACASCHFHAGADSRSRNQLNPGTNGGNGIFDTGGPGYQLKLSDYPFHRLADPDNSESALLRDSDDVTSSAGVLFSNFVDISPGFPVDIGRPAPDPLGFSLLGVNTRRVPPRNSPTVINAVFNFRSFWDGRAQNDFNGVNPFGSRDPDALLLMVSNGEVGEVSISLNNASLASQAVGPPLSGVEMSQSGRTFKKLGKKLLSLPPLARQLVHPEDSVLGPYARDPRRPGRGLRVTYKQLIQQAFQPMWWDACGAVTMDVDGHPVFTPGRQPVGTDEYTLMEYNFSLFFGLAIQLYESTLVSDDTPLDRFLAGNHSALTQDQQLGLSIFKSKGQCVNCHGGGELTNAAVTKVSSQRVERMFMGGFGAGLYDDGFYNIGVRPSSEDPGVGGMDPFGNPLSEAHLLSLGRFSDPSLMPASPCPNERVAVKGSFKVPGLRNVELTAPYFHNGGQATLRQVVEFYNRGADFRKQNAMDVDPDIGFINLTEAERDALVHFLIGLTDERVRKQQAPFDHPQLFVSDGGAGQGTTVENFIEIRAVGRSGGPLDRNFLQ